MAVCPRCGSTRIKTSEIAMGSEYITIYVCENCGFEGFPAEF